MFPIIAPSWAIPEVRATSEKTFLSRRQLVAGMGAAGLVAGALGAAGCRSDAAAPLAEPLPEPGPDEIPNPSPYTLPGFTERADFQVDRPVTPRALAARYNNYYEFTTRKDRVWRKCAGFPVRPWTVEVTGEVGAGRTWDVDELLTRFPLEQRVYRFRCVEAWSMVVPWVGFSLRELLKASDPTGQAKYVRFESFDQPSRAIGQLTQPWYPWPYHEGLRMDEAMHELTMLVVGAYGQALPTQHGAPLRLVVPWKYGFKNIKAITRIELVREQPDTLWNTVAPLEYGFLGNVDPRVPHPRWSQARERDLETQAELPTLPYNGYGEQVSRLYTG
ncbi:MAG: protein-methionine-sulfoxide reductase catalytic subunit MsrP [Alphaproteobacteria bacterium]|nr:protein-methionine-sulfoxide reductase catalytic subunit MsrP [Alphaproteobacteria bacterium]